MSLHGFHFEIKAVKDEMDSKYSFFLQVCVFVFRYFYGFFFLLCFARLILRLSLWLSLSRDPPR